MSDCPSFDGTPLADPEERQVIFAALDSFRQYRRTSHFNITHRRRQNLYALPEQQWQILAAPPLNLLDTLNDVDDALDLNADIADAILELGLRSFNLPAEPKKGSLQDWHGAAKSEDLVKVHSTIRQLYRDWSNEGFTAEVKPLLEIVLEDLATSACVPAAGSEAPSLLMPGAGLGRLLFTLCLHGYNVEGNEISYHQLLASNFILNTTSHAQQYPLYPFVGTFTNNKSRANQSKRVYIPDIHPATVVSQRTGESECHGIKVGDMKMTAGDFLTSYESEDDHGKFDAVITIYFIDTAPNLIRYIKTIYKCLRNGGVWINIGPLLWHFDDRRIEPQNHMSNGAVDSGNEHTPVSAGHLLPLQLTDAGIAEPGSFELSDEEVRQLVERMGFEVRKHDYVPTKYGGYIQDPRSMVQNRYECSHWIARKPL